MPLLACLKFADNMFLLALWHETVHSPLRVFEC